jgi:hypothetical protein
VTVDVRPVFLFEQDRVIVEDKGDVLDVVTVPSASLTPEAALQLSKVLERWATRLVPAQEQPCAGDRCATEDAAR